MNQHNDVPGATLLDLANELAGARVLGESGTWVRDVRHDSRSVAKGDLFVARKGQRQDGARFAHDAIARGAAAICAETPLDVSVPVLLVPDAEYALAVASSSVWRNPTFYLEVLGVTGTNGKTTTTWLLHHAMELLAMKPGLLGTVEHRFQSLTFPALHTTPEADDLARRAALMRNAGAEHLVMEVSSHALALKRVAAVRFRVAALTNVTVDHLDFHGTFEQYAATKKSFFLAHGPAHSVLNIDDRVGAELAEVVYEPITYSARGAKATFSATSCEFDTTGLTASITTPEGSVLLRSPLTGLHNVENLLAAIGSLWALGVPPSRAVEALAHARGAPGRLERVAIAHDPTQPAVFVDYAHTPDALTRVLTALRASVRGRLFCLFGCGGDRDATKRPLMGAAVAAGADVAVLTTDNPRTEDPASIIAMAEEGLVQAKAPRIEKDALKGAQRGYTVLLDRREAIEATILAAGEGDVVLLAGKGHEPYQEIHGVRHPFDDREEARNALAQRQHRGG